MLALPQIRLAERSDAQHIAEMSRHYIEDGLGWSWNSARVLGAIEDDSTNVAVIDPIERGVRQRELAGFAIMHYGEHTAHLALLAVHPAHRRRGLGTRLLGWLERCAVTAGIGRIRLEARADNPAAVAFYRGLGYEPSGVLRGYYRSVLDAIRLEKRLWSAQDAT
jgi:[ribosomal protein S18]-alanine N-acetyltransferase